MKRLIDLTDEELKSHFLAVSPRDSTGRRACAFVVLMLREADDSVACVTNVDTATAVGLLRAVADNLDNRPSFSFVD
jgi:hypothetical protein